MPKVNVESNSNHSPEETFNKVKEFIANDQDLKSLDPSYKCDFDDSGLTGKAKGSKFKADIKVSSSGSGAQVEIIVDLPMMLTPFKGKVQSALKDKLDRLLA